ncbi:cation diffusion facilitator family transporter [Croceicoccus sp. F390]|uniref:Cation diffusion facilitator family transporter n=1 Tax=Croceicoccus esteveae TaxID=3075597 RepID=A0ABU2ZJR8_9SPHN|nr:cation diffusion facilitator family transporter [Croceicoccus sp. F390]MDT0576845.1 cation diffusion facilitator family transporter [Croceicoccus sp. F390]
MTNEGRTMREQQRAMLTRSAAVAGLGVALLLVFLKLWAVWRTGSAAMLGSLADTAIDLLASLATLLGVWIAARPADHDHRFGHGKAEALSALVQVVLISLSACGIAIQAVQRLSTGARTEAAGDGIAVSVIAIVATLALLGWQRHVIHRTGSIAIQTDHVHYKSDLLLNAGVILALLLDQYGGVRGADPVIALVIAGWLAWSAWGTSHVAIDNLMDKEWPVGRREDLLDVMRGHPALRGVHDLRTRTSGQKDFAQFHIAVDGAMTVAAAHDVIDDIENLLGSRFPDTEFLIHTDPFGHCDAPSERPVDLLTQGVDADFPSTSPDRSAEQPKQDKELN